MMALRKGREENGGDDFHFEIFAYVKSCKFMLIKR